MIVVLGGLLADYTMRRPTKTARPGDPHGIPYLELGPGGSTNVAITAARLGLSVACLGEVGDDLFGEVVLRGLARESIDTRNIQVTAGARTPVANVFVDERGKPTYLGYPGTLQLAELPDSWRQTIAASDALFSDGWAEHDGVPALILDAFRQAAAADVPVFFDPGPGNWRVDNGWHLEAVSLSNVLMATEEEAARLTGREEPRSSAEALLAMGPRLVIIKRGPAGCLLLDESGLEMSPGIPVAVRDNTGAGDSFDGAVIHGCLRGLSLPHLGMLANATGAAKVQKLGTGHNMPTSEEIRNLLDRLGGMEVAFGLP